jgi:hypothetical protein
VVVRAAGSAGLIGEDAGRACRVDDACMLGWVVVARESAGVCCVLARSSVGSQGNQLAGLIDRERTERRSRQRQRDEM